MNKCRHEFREKSINTYFPQCTFCGQGIDVLLEDAENQVQNRITDLEQQVREAREMRDEYREHAVQAEQQVEEQQARITEVEAENADLQETLDCTIKLNDAMGEDMGEHKTIMQLIELVATSPVYGTNEDEFGNEFSEIQLTTKTLKLAQGIMRQVKRGEE